MTDAKRFVVDRSRWLRGRSEIPSQLHHPASGKMCCLGFVCVTRGVPVEHITNRSNPNSIDEESRRLIGGLLVDADDYSNTPRLTWDAMSINDDESLNDSRRELGLAALFAHAGYEMVFVDGGEP